MSNVLMALSASVSIFSNGERERGGDDELQDEENEEETVGGVGLTEKV